MKFSFPVTIMRVQNPQPYTDKRTNEAKVIYNVDIVDDEGDLMVIGATADLHKRLSGMKNVHGQGDFEVAASDDRGRAFVQLAGFKEV